MKRLNLYKIIGFAVLFCVVLGASAAPALADEWKPPFVRLTVFNDSQFEFKILVYGPQDYTLTVEPHSHKAIVVERGEYAFVMHACNNSAAGTLDLNMYRNIYVPVCGGSAKHKTENLHNFDTSAYIKGVNITVHNKTPQIVHLYLRNEAKNYWLTIKSGEKLTMLVLRDDYIYSFYACDDLQAGTYSARVNQPLVLQCKNK